MTTKIYGDAGFDSSVSPGIVKVVRVHDIERKYFNGVAGTHVAVPDIWAEITPTSVSSKILILAHFNGEQNSASEENQMLGLERNGTAIGMPTPSGTEWIGLAQLTIPYHNNDDSTPENANFFYLDSPASTSKLKYQLTYLCGNSGVVWYNSCKNSATSGGYERLSSGITLMEILV